MYRECIRRNPYIYNECRNGGSYNKYFLKCSDSSEFEESENTQENKSGAYDRKICQEGEIVMLSGFQNLELCEVFGCSEMC